MNSKHNFYSLFHPIGCRAWLSTLVILLGLLFCCLPSSSLAKGSCGKGGAVGKQLAVAFNNSFYDLLVPTSYTPTKPMPMLVALHGDEGRTDYIRMAWESNVWTAKNNFILLAPRAPYPGGGAYSWWAGMDNNAPWLSSLIEKLATEYNFDLDRVWVMGWSGGGTFLGDYALQNQHFFAAVQYIKGGAYYGYVNPPSSNCKIPARFAHGTADTNYDMYNKARNLYNVLVQHGHEAVFRDLPGYTHDIPSDVMDTLIKESWDWLSKHTLCGTTTPDTCYPTQSKQDAGSMRRDLGVSPRFDQGGMNIYRDQGQEDPEEDSDSTSENKSRSGVNGAIGGCCSVNPEYSQWGGYWPITLTFVGFIILSRKSRRKRNGSNVAE